jgi:hypothetical protein
LPPLQQLLELMTTFAGKANDVELAEMHIATAGTTTLLACSDRVRAIQHPTAGKDDELLF